MDKEFLVGCITAVLIVGIIAGAIVTGFLGDEANQLEFARICTTHGKSVVYENVNDNLVSECK